jgi:predicted Zn-dependent protease with MMP-like domain
VWRRNLPHVSTARSSRQQRRIRRDRHGRGLRGPLYPASLPVASSRAEKFDQLVLDALEPIEARWRDQLTKLDVAVDDVPEVRGRAAQAEGVLHDGAVPLSRLLPAGVDRTGLPTRARIVLYRRPLEARAKDPGELAELVHDVLVEQVAGYLGVEPDVIEGE